jgi:hypothetical protein
MDLTPVTGPVTYSIGVSEWRKSAIASYPLLLGPNSRPYWNNVSVSPHVITESSSGRYVISWIVASNMVSTPVFTIMGQGEYSSLINAERADYDELVLTDFPVVELRPLYKLIYEVRNSFANITNSDLVEVLDIRYLQSAGGVIPGAPGATGAVGSTGPTGPQGPPGTVTGSWTLSTGANTVSFTVDQNNSYVMWVRGNVPNGIVTWNATVSITNSNVPAVGTSYAWYYLLGNALVLTSIPTHIV